MKSISALPDGCKRDAVGEGYTEDLIESDNVNMSTGVMVIHEYSLCLTPKICTILLYL